MVLQANLIVQFSISYGTNFRIASEVLLDTLPKGSTPDVVLYPAQPFDYRNDPSRRTDAPLPLLTIEIQSASQSTKEMTDRLE